MLYEPDINENELLNFSPKTIDLLLKDHTTQKNIFWASDSYQALGKGYQYFDPITIESVASPEHTRIIRPRAVKSKDEQVVRTRDKAEVFTPSWLCNEQNNLIDEAWFGTKASFNRVDPVTHMWETNENPITFPKEKTWKQYVRATRMEITCGEAPYLVSRYDTTTGEPILPLYRRIGVLDRKLRIISENATTSEEWLKMAQTAYKSIYGFEWQGDNLLLARESLLISFIEYYFDRFGILPKDTSIEYIAYIVSWNIWQMDGLKGVIPLSCRNWEEGRVQTLFGKVKQNRACPGCEQNDIYKHKGIYCLLRDWGRKDPNTEENNRKIRFVDLIK